MIGQRFGNYHAVSLLGEGGMGAVYLAEHPDIGRKVAVKVLRPEFIREPQLIGRFLNEARAANAIRHPNIIEILDSGTTDNGMPYLVMELLEGETLAARLRRLGQLPLAMALEFAYQTASAVGAAHKKAIVHRDLKPDNLFIVADQSDPSRERIKVLDFGIAKLQAQGPADSVKTRTGTLMGTPIYMSPEQTLGTKEVDHRSDIYSLGVIVFEMICGRPPFSSQGFGELVHMHLNVAPPSPRSLVPALPEAVDALILKMLAKRPEDRFASMSELQERLKGASGAGVVVRGASTPDFSAGTLPTAAGLAAPPTSVLPIADDTRPRQSTTFSTGVGERLGRTPGPRRGLALVMVTLGLVAAAGGVWLTKRSPARPQASTPPDRAAVPAPVAAPKPPPAPATVSIGVDSRPPGARVVRIADGALLGTTPVKLTLPAGDGAIEIRVDKDGYEPATRTIALFGDHQEMVPLKARPPSHIRRRPAHAPATEEPAKL